MSCMDDSDAAIICLALMNVLAHLTLLAACGRIEIADDDEKMYLHIYVRSYHACVPVLFSR